MGCDGAQESVNWPASRLVLMDLRNEPEAEWRRIDDGFCLPKGADGERVVSGKLRKSERGIWIGLLVIGY